MGLKFERSDNLDKLFADFVVDPENKVAPKEDINRFLKPEIKEPEKKKNKKKS
ncbi:SPJ_0845 family protein [Candidatus Enterococcus huntleyi]|uniref:SPJ_0845 family protein n=1 Tax=Candidatus Enterococcus huntleyi TaxID=1857217 RepID=UPI00192A2547|nr:SPJ_0845 family protein [Enterococcus sp. JM4C]